MRDEKEGSYSVKRLCLHGALVHPYWDSMAGDHRGVKEFFN